LVASWIRDFTPRIAQRVAVVHDHGTVPQSSKHRLNVFAYADDDGDSGAGRIKSFKIDHVFRNSDVWKDWYPPTYARKKRDAGCSGLIHMNDIGPNATGHSSKPGSSYHPLYPPFAMEHRCEDGVNAHTSYGKLF
jgi:hypothetical protein